MSPLVSGIPRLAQFPRSSCCSRNQNFSPFYGGMVFHCMDTLTFAALSLVFPPGSLAARKGRWSWWWTVATGPAHRNSALSFLVASAKREASGLNPSEAGSSARAAVMCWADSSRL